MNILQIISFYLKMKKMNMDERIEAFGPGICKIFAGKAASAYVNAKIIIKLINAVADKVNNDLDTKDLLRVVFIPNYNVSLAEIIFPATDVSEQISTAGMEASGTGNMKACMNGAVIVGTLDGANVEIKEQVGDENIVIFGAETADVNEARKAFSRGAQFPMPAGMREALDAIRGGMFGPAEYFRPLTDSLYAGNDYYCCAVDFDAYCEAFTEFIIPHYRGEVEAYSWPKKVLNNIARMGFFSSDRSIQEYCDRIWGVKPSQVGVLNMTLEE